MLSNNNNYPIGLDVSDLSIKLIQLKKQSGKIKIQAIGKIDLPPGVIDDGQIVSQEQLVLALKKLMTNLKYGKIHNDEVVLNLPENKTFIKLIKITKNPNPIEETISQEIEKHIPMSIDEIYFDWQIIEDQPDYQLVLIGAAPQIIVTQYIDLMEKIKLSTVALEIESISLCRSLLKEEFSPEKRDLPKNYGIINISAQSTNMTIYSKNTILFTVSMPISGEKITQTIAKELAIDPSQAEKAKIICELDEKKARGVIKNVLSEMIDDLVGKIDEALSFYESHFFDRGPITEIILCGGGANIKNLEKIIGQRINIATRVGDALINLGEAREKFSKILTEIHSLNNSFFNGKQNNQSDLMIEQDESLSFACSVGLALRGFLIEEF